MSEDDYAVEIVRYGTIQNVEEVSNRVKSLMRKLENYQNIHLLPRVPTGLEHSRLSTTNSRGHTSITLRSDRPHCLASSLICAIICAVIAVSTSYCLTLPIGSRNITRDIMATNLTEERADEVKRIVGDAVNAEPKARRQTGRQPAVVQAPLRYTQVCSVLRH